MNQTGQKRVSDKELARALQDMRKEELMGVYSRMPRTEVLLLRERLAIKPNEFYRLGMDPEREAQLEAMTDVLMRDLTAPVSAPALPKYFMYSTA